MKIKRLIKEMEKLYPNPKTELYYNNNFQLLIAIILSAQATDKQVNKVNAVFFETFATPKDLFLMGEKKINNYISSIGLHNFKAKNIFKTSKILYENHNSLISDQIEELQKLPGVGIKTAKVWLNVAKNKPYLAVDTHVHRVLNRIGIVNTKTPLQTDKEVEKKFKKNDIKKLHNSLVLFGRYNCKAKNPKCIGCGLKDICNYYKKIEK